MRALDRACGRAVGGRTSCPTCPRRARRVARLAGAALVLAVILGFPGVEPAGALDVPYLAARVNDLAGTLSPGATERLEKKLAELESRTGAQVAVLTVSSLEGESLEGYSVRVAQTWKLGRKGVDDGVLFLVAKNDRKMRIEVGYGLEARLTDALTRQILDDRVRPRFRANDFDGGIEAGVDAIAALIGGQPLPKASGGTSRGMPWAAVLVMGSIFTVVVGVHSLVALMTPGFMGWFLYLFLMPFYAAFPTVMFPPYGGVVACGAWIVLYPILHLWLAPGTADFKARHPGLAGFTSSGRGSSGGGWSSSGGGGGFSGGGGSFGGGGSSSSW